MYVCFRVSRDRVGTATNECLRSGKEANNESIIQGFII